MIVDDEWVNIVSANIDENSFKLSRGITLPKLVRELKIRLWQEHLQDYAENLCDFKGFGAQEKIAQDDGRNVSKTKA